MADYFADGDVIGDFEILEKLGKGASGEVYLVRHQLLGQLKAMKIIMSDKLFTDPVMKERFLREARIAATIRHPNLVEVSNVSQFEDLDLSYIVMEYVEGESLKDYILRTPEIPVDYALYVVHEAAAALDAISRHGVVHRDIKPSNIMLPKKGGVKLADLGIAKISGGAEFNDIIANDVTLDNVIIGTPAYSSPEQCRNASKVDVRSDIYSLGMCLYEMLTRTIPFESTSIMGMLEEVLFREVPQVSQVRPNVPPAVCAFCMRMIAKEPGDRPQTPAEVMKEIEALREMLKGNAAGAAPQTVPLQIRQASAVQPEAVAQPQLNFQPVKSAPSVSGLKPLVPPKMLKMPRIGVPATQTAAAQTSAQTPEQTPPDNPPGKNIPPPKLEMPTLDSSMSPKGGEEVIIAQTDDENYQQIPFSWKNLPAMVTFVVTKLIEGIRTSLREFGVALVLCICGGGAVAFGLSMDLDTFVGNISQQNSNMSSFRAYQELPNQMSEKKRKQYRKVLARDGDWQSILQELPAKRVQICIKELCTHNEPDAQLLAATLKMMYPDPKGKKDDFLPLMEKAAELGSLEAAGFLQTWYGCSGDLKKAEFYEKLSRAVIDMKQKD